MVLNIFPRREKPQSAPAPEVERTLPEPAPEALEESPARRPTRLGSRGGRGRKPAATATTTETLAEEPQPEPEAEAPAPRARRSRAAKPPAEPVEATEAPAEAAPAPARKEPRAPKAQPAAATAATSDLSGLIRAVEAQGKQIDHLVKAQDEFFRRAGGTTVAAAAPPPRVGVFVDAANVELAIDRLRARVDWRKVLAVLTEGRNLVRAIAYSPVHDDPGVSIETQRFAEPFLGKGFKVVTKPLKRFADGTIKANVDIEMALDIVEMLDRLDVVCLVSGDGDFQRLVEVVQSKGVRVEVIAVGTSTAANLRNAADSFTDLQSVLPKVKV